MLRKLLVQAGSGRIQLLEIVQHHVSGQRISVVLIGQMWRW